MHLPPPAEVIAHPNGDRGLCTALHVFPFLPFLRPPAAPETLQAADINLRRDTTFMPITKPDAVAYPRRTQPKQKYSAQSR